MGPTTNNHLRKALFRNRGTTRTGRSFSEATKQIVWQMGRPIAGRPSNLWRLDRYGALMYWPDYGRTDDGGHGWEIDHILPVDAGGTDWSFNLQPLQWQNNRSKGRSTDGRFTTFRYTGVL